MIDEKELKSYIERLHNEHHGGKGDWHFRLALRKVLYFIDAMNKRGSTSMDAIKTKRMKTIDEFATEYSQDKYLPVQTSQAIKAGANHVLEEIEKELTRRMLEDYNQGAEEDDTAQGCMASMIMFVRQLKK